MTIIKKGLDMSKWMIETDHDLDLSKLTGDGAVKKEQIIILTEAGSKMYGMNTPESDEDYLGIFMPTKRQLLLKEFPNQVHFPKDSGKDLQLWSIHYFLKLACSGETMAIDLLHAPEECWKIFQPDIWLELVRKRTEFYSKNMHSFVSYAIKQAGIYGAKGDRIEALEKVIKYLDTKDDDLQLHDIWGGMPTGDHIHFLMKDRNDNPLPYQRNQPLPMYQVNGRKFQSTVRIWYMKQQLQKVLTEYGERANLAKENKGIDWKALSHALRAMEQIYFIFRYGDYEYPLANAKFFKGVKQGKWDFLSVVQPALEESMKDVEEQIANDNHFPEKIDRSIWEDWLINLLQRKLF